jgi:hypothetical protein
MKLGTYDTGKTLLYVSSSNGGGAVWGNSVVPANRRFSISSSGVKTWRPFSMESCPILVISREGDKMTLSIDGVCLEEGP